MFIKMCGNVADCFFVPHRNDDAINEQLLGISSLSIIPVPQNTVIATARHEAGSNLLLSPN